MNSFQVIIAVVLNSNEYKWTSGIVGIACQILIIH